MTKSKNTAEIKFRGKPEEKDTVNQDANAAGLSISDYVRSVLLCEKKAVFLVEGAEISKSLFLIRRIWLIFAATAVCRSNHWTLSPVRLMMWHRNCIRSTKRFLQPFPVRRRKTAMDNLNMISAILKFIKGTSKNPLKCI